VYNKQIIMSNLSTAAEYYQPLSSVGLEELRERCAPMMLIDKTTHPDGIGVRQIDSAGHWFENTPTSAKLHNYMDGVCVALADLAQHSDPYPEFARRKYDWKAGGIDLPSNKIIDPRIVTGKLTGFSISAVAPSELPFAMKPNYKDAVMVGGQALRAYFRLIGTLKIGGSTSITACAISATAVSELRQSYGDQASAWVYRVFSVKARRYSATSASVLWQQVRQQAATNEAVNKLRPFAAG
jgi:hypothetical protein